MTKSISSREFNQDIGKAKRMADDGPVIVTDRGNPAYVLMSHAEYVKLIRGLPSILDLLDHPESAHIDFEPQRMKGGRIRSKGLV